MAIAHIKKYAKLLTLPIAFYSFFSFSSSHANANQEDLSKLSASQLKTKYETELYSAVEDKKIYSPEVEKLDKILGHYLKAKEKGYSKADVKPVKDRKKNIIVNDSIDSIIKDFEENVLFNYPDILVKEGSVKYDGFKIIFEGEIFKSLINRTYDLKKEKHLASLLNKESYEIRDLKIFSNILKDFENYAQNISTPAKEVVPLGLIRLSLSDEQLKAIKQSYEKYLTARDEEFAEAKKYWSPGVTITLSNGSVGLSNGLDYAIRNQLNTSFAHQGYSDVFIWGNVFGGADFKGKFPVPWWILGTLGLGFPFIRNGLLAKYTKRKFDSMDISEGLIQLMFGSLLDCTHPLVFPIRMFGTPFVLEPMRRIFKIYNV